MNRRDPLFPPGARAQNAPAPNVPKVKLTTLPDILCPKCGNPVWSQGIVIKRLSPLVSSSGKEELNAVQVMSCGNCGALLPDERMGILHPDTLKKMENPKI